MASKLQKVEGSAAVLHVFDLNVHVDCCVCVCLHGI